MVRGAPVVTDKRIEGLDPPAQSVVCRIYLEHATVGRSKIASEASQCHMQRNTTQELGL